MGALQVFKKIEKQLPQLTTLDLQYVSPELLKAKNLDLAVPGMLPSFQVVCGDLMFRNRNVPEREAYHQDRQLCIQAHGHLVEAAPSAADNQRQRRH